ncbi:MAG: geranylgeranylglyceryl/heptaprenylglyceryl phosphate synthase [Planctomycetia bacterium]|nr:geranylgeranylglyceryl/heptaprenylglyceryl phosphate synthase [Planctomycetia bacterium]
MKTKVYNYLLDVIKNKGAGYFVLIDPDQKNHSNIDEIVQAANESEVDALLVGGSLMMDAKNHDRVAQIKKNAKMPVIFFPGGVTQLNDHYDAMFFMSILSGRNPHYLIGEQAIAAPIVKDIGIETIPMGYLLLDGGTTSTVEFMSSTKPIPMDRPDITVAHALAAQYLGKKFVYLEAGSGAKIPAAVETIEAVSNQIEIPIIVGGGIKKPKDAEERVKAGASFIVTGTIAEKSENLAIIKDFSEVIHWK